MINFETKKVLFIDLDSTLIKTISGKTTLSESLLFESGVIRKLGRVDSRAPENVGESHGTTKPVGVTLKTKTLKPIS